MNYYKQLSSTAQSEIIETLMECLEYHDDNETLDEYDLHNRAFNEDYFIIGYYNAEEWLKKHIGIFDAIEIVKEYEIDHFGSFNTDPNAEAICNMLVYIVGEELVYSIPDFEVSEIKNYLEDL